MTKRDEDAVVSFILFCTCFFMMVLSYRIENLTYRVITAIIATLAMIAILVRSVYVHKKFRLEDEEGENDFTFKD